MIKYICTPIVIDAQNSKLKEKFEDLQKEINIVNKCPSIYYKADDICCPSPLENNKCPIDSKSNDVTHINGMPICSLNVEASVNWKDNYGKLLYLCTDLPPISSPYERIVDNNMCNKNMKLINNKCYPVCPPGFEEIGITCVQKAQDREALSEPTTCSNDSENINGKCLKKCNLGYNKYGKYCIPSQLSGF